MPIGVSLEEDVQRLLAVVGAQFFGGQRRKAGGEPDGFKEKRLFGRDKHDMCIFWLAC